jgi:hypothetical protein
VTSERGGFKRRESLFNRRRFKAKEDLGMLHWVSAFSKINEREPEGLRQIPDLIPQPRKTYCKASLIDSRRNGNRPE